MDADLRDALTGGYLVPSLPRIDSVSEPGDFDDAEETGYRLSVKRNSIDIEHAYDLRPPPPTATDRSAELIAERLFSVDHLNAILKNHAQFQRFATFLMQYRTQCVLTLMRYLDSQKALKAI
jgi:hypothetical protein